MSGNRKIPGTSTSKPETPDARVTPPSSTSHVGREHLVGRAQSRARHASTGTRAQRISVGGSLRSVLRTALILLFLGSLLPPLFGMRLHPSSEQQIAEGRETAPFPEIAMNLEAINNFPAAFEAFFTDRLGFRQRFIQLIALIKVKVLGVSPNDRVLIGKDGWLFMAAWPPGADSVIQQHSGVRLFTEVELERWKTALESRRNWLAGRGIRYLFVVAPDKHSIYPEFLPDYVNGVRETTPADQFMAYMEMHSDVPILDLRPPLRAAKKQGTLYWRADAHWNELGTFVAYREIIGFLSKWFPALRPWTVADFDIMPTEGRHGDLGRGMHLARLYYEVGPELLPKRPRRARAVEPALLPKPGGKNMQMLATQMPFKYLPRALMLQDSFAYTLTPFVSEHFSRLVYLTRPGLRAFLQGSRTDPFLETLVAAENPQVVIDQAVERTLIWVYRDYE